MPSLDEMREKIEEVFGKRPCLVQLKVIEALLFHKKNVIFSAPTGFGKSLTFYAPLLFKPGVIFTVTSLNILGKQNVEQLKAIGVDAIYVNGASDIPSAIKVKNIRHYST